jgi:hypothetical protein
MTPWCNIIIWVLSDDLIPFSVHQPKEQLSTLLGGYLRIDAPLKVWIQIEIRPLLFVWVHVQFVGADPKPAYDIDMDWAFMYLDVGFVVVVEDGWEFW